MNIEIIGKVFWNHGPTKGRFKGSKRSYISNTVVVIDEEKTQYPFMVFGGQVKLTNLPKGTEVKVKFKLSHRQSGSDFYPIYKIISFERCQELTTS